MAGGPSIAKGLFDAIRQHPDPVLHLQRMVNSVPPTVEHEYLDFKGATDPTTGREIDPRKTWSEALAAFATTGGGVLIWGIDARKDTSGVDHAGALNLVPNPAAWRSRLQELHLQATDPPVPGVIVEAYPDSASDGKGFVVCYIPESDYKPHRAEMSNRRWMMRIGSNFVDVPPPVLRSLFFPQRQSYISMEVESYIDKKATDLPHDEMRVVFTVSFLNEGPATAHDFVATEVPAKAKTYACRTFWQSHESRSGRHFMRTSPFHPGTSIELGELRFDVPRSSGWSRQEGAVDIEFHLHATDQQPQAVKVHFSHRDIEDNYRHKAAPVPLPATRFQ